MLRERVNVYDFNQKVPNKMGFWGVFVKNQAPFFVSHRARGEFFLFPVLLGSYEKNMNEAKPKVMAARLASLDELIENTLPNFLSPVPGRDTLRTWFERASIPRLKANPTATRGGGKVFYSVSAVEKLLQGTIPGGWLGATTSKGAPD